MALMELSVVDQRYSAVMEVMQHGLAKAEVARRYGVSRQTVHSWVNRYRTGGVEALKDGSHRPDDCPHQMSGAVEARQSFRIRSTNLADFHSSCRSSFQRPATSALQADNSGLVRSWPAQQ